MFEYQRPLTIFMLASDTSIFPASDMSSRAFSQEWWTSDIKVAGAGSGLTNRVYWRMRVLARVITAASAPVAIFGYELVPGQTCSYCGVLGSPGGLELLTPDVVTLCVASGDKYGGKLEDVNVGGVYALPWIIRRGAAGVRLTSAAPCNPEVVETRTVETRVFACCLSAVREWQRVPGALSSSGMSLSSASGSLSDSV